MDNNLAVNLEEIMNRVFTRRSAHVPTLPLSSFKLPGRSAFHENRKTAWIKELANPEIPLQNLGRSVLSGFKGHELLDLLQSNEITIPRAVWFIRIVGGNETVRIERKTMRIAIESKASKACATDRTIIPHSILSSGRTL